MSCKRLDSSRFAFSPLAPACSYTAKSPYRLSCIAVVHETLFTAATDNHFYSFQNMALPSYSNILRLLLVFVTSAMWQNSLAAPVPRDFLLRTGSIHVSASSFSRGVADVGPALSNATTSSLHELHIFFNEHARAAHVIFIPSGLLLAFFGRYLLPPLLLISGFVLGAALSFVSIHAAFPSPPKFLPPVAAVLGGGFLAGVASRLVSFGALATGGALAAAAAAAVVPAVAPNASHWTLYVAVALAALVGAIIGAACKNYMLVASTAFGGAAISVASIAWLLGLKASGLAGAVCGAVTGIIGALGAAVQLGKWEKCRPERGRSRIEQGWDSEDDQSWVSDREMERQRLRRENTPVRVKDIKGTLTPENVFDEDSPAKSSFFSALSSDEEDAQKISTNSALQRAPSEQGPPARGNPFDN